MPFDRTFKTLSGFSLPNTVQFDRALFHQEVLIKRSPVETALTLLYHSIGVRVDYAELLLVLKANQLGDVWIRVDIRELRVDRHCELDRRELFFRNVE